MQILLKQYLKKRDISLAKLCRMTGLCYKTIDLWALGKTRSVIGDAVDKICYALNCTPNDIIKPDIPENREKIKRIIER